MNELRDSGNMGNSQAAQAIRIFKANAENIIPFRGSNLIHTVLRGKNEAWTRLTRSNAAEWGFYMLHRTLNLRFST